MRSNKNRGEIRADGFAQASEVHIHPKRLNPSPNYAYFEAVSRYGSIRKAANALHIASSAVNRRILDLEEEVGCPLFERLPRGVRLTAAGELVLAYVRRSFKELHALEEQIEQLQSQVRGFVRIAVAESVTPSLLPETMDRYAKSYPGVSFHVTVDGPEGLNAALVQDHVDLVLTHQNPDRPAISVLASASHPLCALVAPGHELAQRESVQLSEMLAYPWVMPDETLAVRTQLNLALEHAGVQVTPTLESNSVETLKTYVRFGQAVGFSFNFGNAAETIGLVALELRDPHCADARLYLATRRGRVLPVAAACFAELLAEEFRQRVGLRLMSVE